MNNAKLLTAAEVSDFCNISKATLLRRIRDGQFPRGLKLGKRCIRWRPETVERYLKSIDPAEAGNDTEAVAAHCDDIPVEA